MKVSTKLAILMTLVIFIGSACKTTNDVISERGIQKRKYRSGFFVESRSKAATPDKLAQDQKSVRLAEAAEVHFEDKSTHAPVQSEDQNKGVNDLSLNTPTEVQQSQSTHSLTDEVESNHTATTNPVASKSTRTLQVDHTATTTSIDLNTNEQSDDVALLIYIILALLLPPLAVFLLYGISTEFWISVLLTILFWIPGVIYALILVLRSK